MKHSSLTRITPQKGWATVRVKDLVEYRDLMLFLAWRDVSSRYRQTALGIGWAILQPLIMMVIFSAIFGRLAKLPSDGLQYPVFSYAAMLPWQFFATAFTASTTSLWGNASLLTKIYFPRLVIPVASLLPAMLDFLLAFVILLCLTALYKIQMNWMVLTLPYFILLATITALGLGLWGSSLGVEYRDIRHTLPFILQCGLYASPVAYSTSLIPEHWRLVYALNPMVSVIEGFRWAILGTNLLTVPMTIISTATALTLLISGGFHFRQVERKFADLI